MWRAGKTCAVCAMVWGMWGCKGASERPEITPVERAFLASTSRMSESVVAAVEESEEQEPFTLRARYNPGRCGAPDFEVFARGVWVRSALVARSQELGGVIASFQESAGQNVGAFIWVTGDFARRAVVAANGVEWPAFEVEGVGEIEQGEQGAAIERRELSACAQLSPLAASASGSTP